MNKQSNVLMQQDREESMNFTSKRGHIITVLRNYPGVLLQGRYNLLLLSDRLGMASVRIHHNNSCLFLSWSWSTISLPETLLIFLGNMKRNFTTFKLRSRQRDWSDSNYFAPSRSPNLSFPVQLLRGGSSGGSWGILGRIFLADRLIKACEYQRPHMQKVS